MEASRTSKRGTGGALTSSRPGRGGESPLLSYDGNDHVRRGAMDYYLSGWQRLWIVLSAVYLLVVTVVALLLIPGELPTEARLTAEWTTAAFTMLKAKDPTLKDYSISELQRSYSDLPDRQVIAALERKYGTPAGSANIGANNGRMLVSGGLATLRAYYERELAGLSRERFIVGVRLAGIAIVWWMVPVLGSYALGLAAAWVVRGFRA